MSRVADAFHPCGCLRRDGHRLDCRQQADRLSWQEGEITAEFAGAALNLASLCNHLPDRAGTMRRAAVAKLDGQGRALVVALAAQIEEGS